MDSTLLRISAEPIELADVYRALSSPGCGAQLVFIGVVRDNNEGRKVRAVGYEAFLPLAEQVLAELAREVREKTSSLQVVMLHRVGTLRVGEVSTVVGVASPHRAESYEASRYLIEQLKLRAPIWKEEHYEDGEAQWLDGARLNACDSTVTPTTTRDGGRE